jgi:small subunit ribosomal protein S16
MSLKIRLRKQGRTNRPFYRIVITDVRNPRDGKYIECIGWYNPHGTDEETISIKPDRLKHWLDFGAQPSENAEKIVATGAPEVMKARKDNLIAQKAKKTAQKRVRRQKLAQAS